MDQPYNAHLKAIIDLALAPSSPRASNFETPDSQRLVKILALMGWGGSVKVMLRHEQSSTYLGSLISNRPNGKCISICTYLSSAQPVHRVDAQDSIIGSWTYQPHRAAVLAQETTSLAISAMSGH